MIKEVELAWHVIKGERWQTCVPLPPGLAIETALAEALRNSLQQQPSSGDGHVRNSRIKALEGVLARENEATHGVLGADLASVRQAGIGLAPKPMQLQDNMMEGEGYEDACAIVDNAMCLALMAAPAIIAVISDASPLVQLPLPLLAGHYGLDNADVGTPELLLRCFVQFTSALHTKRAGEALKPMAVLHEAEVTVAAGHGWRSKACRADRDTSRRC